jgi:hypothetical protein
MLRYLVGCQQGKGIISDDVLYMAETPWLYSMENLELAKDGCLEQKVSALAERCRAHITDCVVGSMLLDRVARIPDSPFLLQVCKGRGYLCELCGNNEVIYPFDSSAVGCIKCNSYFHRVCWTRKLQVCPKCIRIERRGADYEGTDSGNDLESDECVS